MVAAIVLSLLVTRESQAGNADSFYLSGEAAMQGGAVVASTTGGGSIWYNPAGLAALRGMRLDVNVSGYAVQFGAEARFDSALPNADQTRLSFLNLDVVPAALTLTRKFGQVGVGIGVFVPAQSSVALRTRLAAPPDDDGTSLEFGYDAQSRVQEYHAGPGLGWSPIEALNLGMSLLGNYRTHYSSSDISGSVVRSDSKYSQSSHSSLDRIGVGLEVVLGAQWQFSPRWALGLAVRTPALRLGDMVDEVDTYLVASSDGELDDSIVFEEKLNIDTRVLNPFRFHLGLSHELGGFRFSGEASLRLPFTAPDLQINDRLTWNARLGLKGELGESWALGGGVFTDRSSSSDPKEFQETQLDYYGVTIAVNWRDPYGVYAEGGKVLEKPRSLVFGTTVALSYALGLGSLASARVGPATDGTLDIEPLLIDVVAHELTLHITTSISE